MWEFMITMFIISITPGTCMTLALHSSLSMGLRKSAFTGLGDLFGLFLYAVLSAVGVATFLSQYPSAIFTIQILGAGYLIYLGLSAILRKKKMGNSTLHNTYKKTSDFYFFRLGLITLLANPKSILFFAVFFPQFLDVNQSIVPQLLLMIPIILLSETIALAVYALGGRFLNRILSNQNMVDWFSGGVLIVIGIWLLTK